jgi:hypothetical protein
LLTWWVFFGLLHLRSGHALDNWIGWHVTSILRHVPFTRTTGRWLMDLETSNNVALDERENEMSQDDWRKIQESSEWDQWLVCGASAAGRNTCDMHDRLSGDKEIKTTFHQYFRHHTSMLCNLQKMVCTMTFVHNPCTKSRAELRAQFKHWHHG